MMSVIDDIMLVVCIFVHGLIYQNIRGVPLVLAIICMYISLKCTCPHDQWSVRKFYLLLIFCVMILYICIANCLCGIQFSWMSSIYHEPVTLI